MASCSIYTDRNILVNFLQALVAKGHKISKAIYGLLDSPNKRTQLTILIIFFTQDSEFHSFFGRIKESINCF